MQTEALVRRLASDDVSAIVLAGSFARGDQHHLSDVDLMLFVGTKDAERFEHHIIEGRLHVVSRIAPESADEWFSSPKLASEVIQGLRTAKILFERDETFSRIQTRARNFSWDADMQRKANRWASSQLAGQVEEVQKGLAGLETGHTGRLLNARFGLSWRLSQIVQVQRGVLLSGDNAFFDEVEAAVTDKVWIDQRRRAFCAQSGAASSLTEQVTAGLQLFVSTARLVHDILQPGDKAVVEHGLRLIREASLT